MLRVLVWIVNYIVTLFISNRLLRYTNHKHRISQNIGKPKIPFLGRKLPKTNPGQEAKGKHLQSLKQHISLLGLHHDFPQNTKLPKLCVES